MQSFVVQCLKLKLLLKQINYSINMDFRIIQRRDITILHAAGRHKNSLVFHGYFFQRFQAVHRKPGQTTSIFLMPCPGRSFNVSTQ